MYNLCTARPVYMHACGWNGGHTYVCTWGGSPFLVDLFCKLLSFNNVEKACSLRSLHISRPRPCWVMVLESEVSCNFGGNQTLGISCSTV